MLDPVLAAERVLDDLRIRDTSDLKLLNLIAQERGATVLEQPLRGAEARIVVVGACAIITISATIDSLRRKRFSLAHELGHFELHRNLGLVNLCDSGDVDSWRFGSRARKPEQQANEFAAALLLPERFFASLCKGCDPSLERVIELADKFDVSLTATAVRYVYFCDEPLAVIFSQNRHITWLCVSDSFRDLELFIPLGTPLDPSSSADLFFRGHKIPPKAKSVEALTWFEPDGCRRGARIQEQSLAMPKQQAVLTFLWGYEDSEDEDYSD